MSDRSIQIDQHAPVQLVSATGRRKAFGLGAANAAAVGTALIAAQTAATSGDLIECFADATVSSSLGKDGVRYWFATETITASGSLDLWSDGGAAMSFVVDGAATFVTTDGRGIALTNAASDVQFRCERVEAHGSSQAGVYLSNGATLAIISNSVFAEYDALWNDGGNLTFDLGLAQGMDNALEATGGSTIGVAREFLAAHEAIQILISSVVQLTAQKITSTDWNQSILISGTSVGIVDCPAISGQVIMEAGTLTLINSRVVVEGDDLSAVFCTSSEGPSLRLVGGCELISHGLATVAIESLDPFTVTVLGALEMTPNAIDSAVTVNRIGLGVSNRAIVFKLVGPGASLDTGIADDFTVPPELNGATITAAQIDLPNGSTEGLTIQVDHDGDNLFSTPPVVDSGENSSEDGTPAVVDGDFDTLVTGDVLTIDVTNSTNTTGPVQLRLSYTI